MDKIDELLTRRVEKIYPSPKALEKVLRSGKKIKLYLGIDPTATRLHLGHTVGLRKLMEFAELGHQTILLFGTGTVLVGDPSLREKGRKLISEKEIEKNIKTWKKQVQPIIDFKKVKIQYNGDWLTKLGLKEIIEIGSKISSVQLFKRKSFTKRIKRGDTVWYHETLYPLLQGYDSVQMNVDLEIGGTDQTFNMLIGRELQKKFNNKEKYVLSFPMVDGTDGHPMSKTRGNCIWLTDNSKDVYGKIMSIADKQIGDYFEFFTQTPIKEVKTIKQTVEKQSQNPIKFKKQLAFEITKQLHGQKKAQQAQEEFEKVFQKGKKPSQIKTIDLADTKNNWKLSDLLVKTNLTSSKSQAKRLIKQGAVEINDKKILKNKKIKINGGEIIKTGKRKIIKIKK